jgi:pimeloyl-ACP methyl ester carboxylesterase
MTDIWDNDEHTIHVDIKDTDHCIVVFGSWFGDVGMHPIEFSNQTASADYSRIFLRDLNKAWFHLGRGPGIGTWWNTLEDIHRVLRQIDPKTITTVGVSMGGHAAIAYGYWLRANAVVSLAGPTSIKPGDLIRIEANVRSVWDGSPETSWFWDLDELLQRPNGKTRYHLHYCCEDRFDALQAEHLAERDGVELHPWPCRTHGVAYWLRDNGHLANILDPPEES